MTGSEFPEFRETPTRARAMSDRAVLADEHPVGALERVADAIRRAFSAYQQDAEHVDVRAVAAGQYRRTAAEQGGEPWTT